MAACGPLAFVARAGLFDVAIVGRVLRAVGAVGVDRSAAGSTGAREAIERHVSRGARWPLLVFPEGTTTNGRGLLRFRSGAFVAGRPATPVVLRYAAPSGFDLAYVDNQNTPGAVLAHFCRCLLERGKTLDVFVLPPVAAARGDDAAAHAARARAAMLAALPGAADWSDWDNTRMRREWYGGNAASKD